MTKPKIELKARVPFLFPKQEEIRKSEAKRKVINAGRRAGKTTLAACIATERFLEGQRVLYAAPVAKQTNTFWKKCVRYLAEGLAAGEVGMNKTNRTLTLGNGGEITCQTAHNADTMRSGEADLLIFDEWAMMHPDAWDKVGAPMLLDSDGDAIFISTPRRKNHHWRFFQWGLEQRDGWAAFEFQSLDNPYLTQKALDRMAADMTEDAYKQEILAQFLEGSGAVFRNITACLNAPEASPEDHKGHWIIAGVDWGMNDYTAISVGCGDCRVELALDRFNQIGYALQRGRLEALIERWGVDHVLAESNSMGEPIIEQLQMDGLPVDGFATTGNTKPKLIQTLQLALEKVEWQFQNDPIGRSELEAYEKWEGGHAGRLGYGAPEGMHDDTVIARALVVWSVSNAPRVLFGV